MGERETGLRDLFVELPRALFESLQAVAEAKVRRADAAQKVEAKTVTNQTRRQRLTILDHLPKFAAAAFGHLGFRSATSRRREDRYIMEIVAELTCGHHEVYELTDQAIAVSCGADVARQIAIVERAIAARPRGCQCMFRGSEDDAT